MLVFLYPQDVLFGILFTLITALTLGLPLRLLKPQIKPLYIFLGILQLGLLSWFVGSLSPMATKNSEFNHCGIMTYTGTFYSIRAITTYAHRDDLEIRNQLCWVRKMITRLPSRFEADIEYETYKKIIDQNLILPPNKFRTSLPLIAFLQGFMLAKLEMNNNPIKHIQSGKMFFDSVQFWRHQYTYEIKDRDYPWWNWPHSDYIRFEYGLVESNWEKIIDGFVIDSN